MILIAVVGMARTGMGSLGTRHKHVHHTLVAILLCPPAVHILGVGSTRPVASSSLTTIPCPFCAASDNGVSPIPSLESGFTLFSSSSLTTVSCPFTAAHDSGVRPDP